MAKEQELQKKIISYLKKKGCYVIKINQDAKSHVGTPDVIAMKEGFWLAIEVKASKTAKFQPLQKETIEKLNEMSWAKVVYPENWEDVQKELNELL